MATLVHSGKNMHTSLPPSPNTTTSSIGAPKRAMQRLNLSARAYDRILRVARTIADLDGTEDSRKEHIVDDIPNTYNKSNYLLEFEADSDNIRNKNIIILV